MRIRLSERSPLYVCHFVPNIWHLAVQMAQNKSGSEDAVSSEIAIPLDLLVNELTMTVRIPKSSTGRAGAESREALSNIRPGEVVVIRLGDLGQVLVDRTPQASRNNKVRLTKKETAILRFLYGARKHSALRPQLFAELKSAVAKRLYISLPPRGIRPVSVTTIVLSRSQPAIACSSIPPGRRRWDVGHAGSRRVFGRRSI